MKQADIVVPIAFKHTDTGYCTPRWFVEYSNYHPVPATFEPLINGEEAFRAVHEAIAGAQKSIDIICWGFQPSMYFVRDGKSPSIGQLLRLKAAQGVEVRVLGWEAPGNLAGGGGEANLPGKRQYFRRTMEDIDRALQSSTDEQYERDLAWFRDCETNDGKPVARTKDRRPLFVSRGFSMHERWRIYKDVSENSVDSNISGPMLAALAGATTHHQKSVLVDYELPEHAVGFVMGHNMLDEYWDTNAHSAKNRTASTKPAPDRGPRGFGPRQDISSRVTGPILEHLHHNFATAWQKETSEDLLTLRKAKEVGKQLRPQGPPLMAQLLRTQAQEGLREIEKLYLQAVNNATQFIYIENQYFRWPPLAEAIKRAALAQTTNGRDPGVHGVLHLFVVTNVTDDGIGQGTVKTQLMLESLGRADTIPEVTKLQRIDKARRKSTPYDPRDRLRAAKLNEEIKEINESTIHPEEIPGLKVHVCSLVADDSPAGQPWMPVYIHTKLMIVDDVFTTIGSANINTRSMQVDTELNIAHEWGNVTTEMRRQLWGLHTGKMGGQDDPSEAFSQWRFLLAEDTRLQKDCEPPCCPLVEFRYTNPVLSNLD